MLWRIFITLGLLTYLGKALANEAQEQAILAPIYQVLDGIREGNGDKVRTAFSEQAFIQRAHDILNNSTTPEDLAKVIDTKGDDIWDEQIWDIEIQTDAKLASVWTQFAFYRNESLSHCGVNSFQLYQFEDGWKIIHLVDTRRTENCAASVVFR